MMIAGIFYIFGCVVVAGVLTFVVAMFRSVQSRDDWKSWRSFALFFLLATFLPYAWAEGMTRYIGTNMRKSVLSGLEAAGIDGKLAYYKVTFAKDKEATVIAVAQETESWGGTIRSVINFKMVKQGKHWTAKSYNIINSDKHNKDGFTFPPYF